MKTIFQKRALCTALLVGIATPAHSALSEPVQNGFEDCRVASNDELDHMRGGFEVTAGTTQFLLSLGFQQVTFINGVLAAITTLNLPQVNSTALNQALGVGSTPAVTSPATSGQVSVPVPPTLAVSAGGSSGTTPGATGAAPPAAPTTLPPNFIPTQIVQNGPGNTYVPPVTSSLPPAVTTLIQNTLDNQVIRNMTIINATIANRQLLASLALSARLDQVLARSMR